MQTQIFISHKMKNEVNKLILMDPKLKQALLNVLISYKKLNTYILGGKKIHGATKKALNLIKYVKRN